MLIIILLLILIFVILYRREIKLIIAFTFLSVIMVVLWEYWWGKIIDIILLIAIMFGIIGIILEKYENSPFIQKRKANNDEEFREKAYLYVMEYWYKQEGPNVESEIQRVRDWMEDPSSNEIMEKWYQENKGSFQ